jgi:hypothetical protein
VFRRDSNACLRASDNSLPLVDRVGLREGLGNRDPNASFTVGVFEGVGYTAFVGLSGVATAWLGVDCCIDFVLWGVTNIC